MKQKRVWHLWQIGTAVITFKYYYTQKQHTALRKKHQDFKSVLFLLEKKNTKHTHFKKQFYLCGERFISYFQRQFNCILRGFFVLSMLFVFKSKLLNSHQRDFGEYNWHLFLWCWVSLIQGAWFWEKSAFTQKRILFAV